MKNNLIENIMQDFQLYSCSNARDGKASIPYGISLYIHIPFCVRKCNYCDFLSFNTGIQQKEEYTDALVAEITGWEEIINNQCPGGFIFRSVFIGGGTPTCLSPSMLMRIVQAVGRHIGRDTEFTIEANPGTVSGSHIQVFKDAGINRISLGLQSAQDSELKTLGRIHTYDEARISYNKLHEAGFDNINIDIMSGIPGQTIESYKDTLYKVLSLEPGHISAYSLIVEPGTVFYNMQEQGKLNIADEDTDRLMYYITEEILKEHGYNRYEISNYSKPGRECIHNVAYWTGRNYLGTGLGASSYIGGCRFKGTDNYSKYIKIFGNSFNGMDIAGCIEENIGSSYEKLSIKAKMEEFMFLGLRMCKGVSRKEFEERFNININKVYGDVINHFLENGLLAEDTGSGNIYLTGRGIDVSNYVLSDFILD